jgi:hypothetical protein
MDLQTKYGSKYARFRYTLYVIGFAVLAVVVAGKLILR